MKRFESTHKQPHNDTGVQQIHTHANKDKHAAHTQCLWGVIKQIELNATSIFLWFPAGKLHNQDLLFDAMWQLWIDATMHKRDYQTCTLLNNNFFSFSTSVSLKHLILYLLLSCHLLIFSFCWIFAFTQQVCLLICSRTLLRDLGGFYCNIMTSSRS